MNQRIRKCLTEKISATFVPTNDPSGRLLSFSYTFDLPFPMDWLREQDDPVKMYWSSRDVHLEVAGTGLADRVDSQGTRYPDQALGKIQKNLTNASADIRYYGGMCFDMTDSPEAMWEGFGHFYFFIPKFELRQENDQSVFLFNIRVTPQDDVTSATQHFLESFEKLSFDICATQKTPDHMSWLPSILQRSDIPDQNTWQQQTRKLIECIQAGHVNKVVQTRITSLELAAAPDPLWLLHDVKSRSINTYDFCFQTRHRPRFHWMQSRMSLPKRPKQDL